MTWQIDLTSTVDEQFASKGQLTNQATDTTGSAPMYVVCLDARIPYDKPGMDSDELVFAFSVDLGSTQGTPDPVVWAVGFVRNPSILYTTPSGGNQERVPYYVTKYGDISEAVSEGLLSSRSPY